MTFLALCTVLIGMLYFCCIPRTFDWFSLAFAAAAVYSLPVVLGYATLAYDIRELHVETYFVGFSILWGVLLAAIVSDCSSARQPVSHDPTLLEHDYATAMTVLACAGMIVSVAHSGDSLFVANKQRMFETFGIQTILWQMGGATGLILAFAAGRRGLVALNAISLVFLWYLGLRSPLTLAAVGVIVMLLSDRGHRAVIGNMKIGASVAALALVVFSYKKLYRLIKLGEWSAVFDVIESDGFLRDSVVNSEAMSRFHIIDSVVLEQYAIPVAPYIRDTIVNTAIPSGVDVDPSFGGWVKADLYPDVSWGIASSIWAEMYSVGGWGLLLAFVALFCFVLHQASLLCIAKSGIIRSVVCAWMPYFAFYIHRNDVYRMLSFLKQYVFLLVLCSALLVLIKGWRLSSRRNNAVPVTPSLQPGSASR